MCRLLKTFLRILLGTLILMKCTQRGPVVTGVQGREGSVCYSLLPHSPLNKLCGPNAYRTLNNMYKALVGRGSGPKEIMPI